MADTKTTLHPEGDLSTNVYPDVLSDNIPSSAVTTAKIADSAVTSSKLADSAVTSAKIASEAVTSDKIASGAISSHADFRDFLLSYFRGKYAGGAWDSAEGSTLLQGFSSVLSMLPSGASFSGCFAHAEYVRLTGQPDSVISLADIPVYINAYGMFNYFKGGREYFLKDGYTMRLGNGRMSALYMFAHMHSTSSETGYSKCARIEVADGKSFKCVGSCGGMFYDCPSLTAIVGIDFSEATSFSLTFYDCTSLATLDVTGISASFDISGTALGHDALVTVIANLATVTSAQTLTMGDDKLALLSDEEKAVATDKGWTLA